jgi:hypothetical protein
MRGADRCRGLGVDGMIGRGLSICVQVLTSGSGVNKTSD